VKIYTSVYLDIRLSIKDQDRAKIDRVKSKVRILVAYILRSRTYDLILLDDRKISDFEAIPGGMANSRNHETVSWIAEI
jgi:hypothetical protein